MSHISPYILRHGRAAFIDVLTREKQHFSVTTRELFRSDYYIERCIAAEGVSRSGFFYFHRLAVVQYFSCDSIAAKHFSVSLFRPLLLLLLKGFSLCEIQKSAIGAFEARYIDSYGL